MYNDPTTIATPAAAPMAIPTIARVDRPLELFSSDLLEGAACASVEIVGVCTVETFEDFSTEDDGSV